MRSCAKAFADLIENKIEVFSRLFGSDGGACCELKQEAPDHLGRLEGEIVFFQRLDEPLEVLRESHSSSASLRRSSVATRRAAEATSWSARIVSMDSSLSVASVRTSSAKLSHATDALMTRSPRCGRGACDRRPRAPE